MQRLTHFISAMSGKPIESVRKRKEPDQDQADSLSNLGNLASSYATKPIQANEYRCTGWKTTNKTLKGDMESAYVPQLSEECRNSVCQHSLEQHISHLADVTDEQTYQLGAVVDVKNLFMSIHNEHADGTKKVYFFLFHVSKFECIAIIAIAL